MATKKNQSNACEPNPNYNNHKRLRFVWAIFYVSIFVILLSFVDYAALCLCEGWFGGWIELFVYIPFIVVAFMLVKLSSEIAVRSIYVPTGLTWLALSIWAIIAVVLTFVVKLDFLFENEPAQLPVRNYVLLIGYIQVFLGVVFNIKTCENCGASGFTILKRTKNEKIGTEFEDRGTYSDVTVGTAEVTFSDGSTSTADIKTSTPNFDIIHVYKHTFVCRHCHHKTHKIVREKESFIKSIFSDN